MLLTDMAAHQQVDNTTQQQSQLTDWTCDWMQRQLSVVLTVEVRWATVYVYMTNFIWIGLLWRYEGSKSKFDRTFYFRILQ